MQEAEVPEAPPINRDANPPPDTQPPPFFVKYGLKHFGDEISSMDISQIRDLVVIDLDSTLCQGIYFNFDVSDRKMITEIFLNKETKINQSQELVKTQFDRQVFHPQILDIARLTSENPSAVLVFTTNRNIECYELIKTELSNLGIHADHIAFVQPDLHGPKRPISARLITFLNSVYTHTHRINVFCSTDHERLSYLQTTRQSNKGISPPTKLNVAKISMENYILSPEEQRKLFTSIISNEQYNVTGRISQPKYKLMLFKDMPAFIEAIQNFCTFCNCKPTQYFDPVLIIDPNLYYCTFKDNEEVNVEVESFSVSNKTIYFHFAIRDIDFEVKAPLFRVDQDLGESSGPAGMNFTFIALEIRHLELQKKIL